MFVPNFFYQTVVRARGLTISIFSKDYPPTEFRPKPHLCSLERKKKKKKL